MIVFCVTTCTHSRKENTTHNNITKPKSSTLSVNKEYYNDLDSSSYFSDSLEPSVSYHHFISSDGDYYYLSFTSVEISKPISSSFIVTTAPCKFKVIHKLVQNTQFKIKLYKNNQFVFSKIIKKNNFNDVFDKNFIKNYSLNNIEFFEFNEKFKYIILRVSFSESLGGTEWFAQAYMTLDEKGNILHKGLIDYPHHCHQLISISDQKDFILTCSEIIFLSSGKKRKFKPENTVLANIINDTLYSLVFTASRDSFLCDTTIYIHNDTLTYCEYVSEYDSVKNNAFIYHINGDTLAQFHFEGYTDLGERYIAQFENYNVLKIAAFYDYKKQTLRIFDYEKNLIENIYYLQRLNKYTKNSSKDKFIEFTNFEQVNRSYKIRFYLNQQKRVSGYQIVS